MPAEQPRVPNRKRKLRLWPGVVVVVVQWLAWYLLPRITPVGYFGDMAGLACGVLVALWWLFFSRARWSDRLGIGALMAVALYATPYILHESLASAGQGFLYYVYAVPALSLALVASVAVGRHLPDGARRVIIAGAILLACGVWALVRTGGSSSFGWEFAWRWSKTPEERLLAQADDRMASTPALGATEAEWPGFRGPDRDGVIPGVSIATDWSISPPEELWRRPVGPGWSSFAVQGDRLYTQEQRGENEVVASYSLTTGEPIWRHGDRARFWEANAGAGPRATPTLSDGRVYTLGGTGLVNALDAPDGTVVWSRDAAADTETETPYWGFAGSPLVLGDIVIVAVSGALVAYESATGEPLWLGPDGGVSYSSPHLMTIDGVEQIVQISKAGVNGVAPADGKLLWEYPWEGYPMVQPALAENGDLLISVSQSSGTRCLVVTNGPNGWTVDERWGSLRLKPYFNDRVVHEGHAYGIDGNMLASINLENGERNWKGGRYGDGQLVLLPDQDLLLVLSEKGELVLVSATPDEFTELARTPVIEGRTWNHPVLVGDTLLVRNDREMAAFRFAPGSVEPGAGL